MENSPQLIERLEKSSFIQEMVSIFLDKVEDIDPDLVSESSSEQSFKKLVYLLQKKMDTPQTDTLKQKQASREAWLKEIEANALTGEASQLFAEGCREFHEHFEMKDPFKEYSKP